MDYKLNGDMDTAALAREYKKAGRVRVRNFLDEESAEALYECLTKRTPWQWSFMIGDKPTFISVPEMTAITDRRQRELMRKVYEQARASYQFLFYMCPVSDIYGDNGDTEHCLHEVHRFMAGEAMTDTLKALTGRKKLAISDSEARWLNHGHFMGESDGVSEDDKSAFALVLEMSRDWRTDWGGIYQFLGDSGKVEEGWIPEFNTLNLIRYPVHFNVSYVAPFTGGLHLAMWGWAK